MGHKRYNKFMKMHKKLTLVTAAVLIVGGAGTGAVLALQPDKEPAKSSVSSQDQSKQSNEAPVESTNPVTNASISEQQAQQTQPTQQANISSDSATVTSYQQIPIDGTEDIDCKLTYSDGETYQWHWKVVQEQGVWVTDSQGQNGHWQPATHTYRECDNSVIGSTR